MVACKFSAFSECSRITCTQQNMNIPTLRISIRLGGGVIQQLRILTTVDKATFQTKYWCIMSILTWQSFYWYKSPTSSALSYVKNQFFPLLIFYSFQCKVDFPRNVVVSANPESFFKFLEFVLLASVLLLLLFIVSILSHFVLSQTKTTYHNKK